MHISVDTTSWVLPGLFVSVLGPAGFRSGRAGRISPPIQPKASLAMSAPDCHAGLVPATHCPNSPVSELVAQWVCRDKPAMTSF